MGRFRKISFELSAHILGAVLSGISLGSAYFKILGFQKPECHFKSTEIINTLAFVSCWELNLDFAGCFILGSLSMMPLHFLFHAALRRLETGYWPELNLLFFKIKVWWHWLLLGLYFFLKSVGYGSFIFLILGFDFTRIADCKFGRKSGAFLLNCWHWNPNFVFSLLLGIVIAIGFHLLGQWRANLRKPILKDMWDQEDG